MYQRKINIIWVDARPRSYKPCIIIEEWFIEDLSFITSESIDVVTSSNIFDAWVYEQDQEQMRNEIVRVLQNWWIYLWIERARTPFEIKWCSKETFVMRNSAYCETQKRIRNRPYVFSVYKKWWGEVKSPIELYLDRKSEQLLKERHRI